MNNDASNTLAAFIAKGSADFQRANAHLLPVHAGRAGTPPKPERTPPRRIPKKSPDEARDPGRYLVRVTSVRNRLLDEDNLIEKWHVDACRYAGLLPSDAPDTTHIETRQRKTMPGEPEHVVITIERA